MSAKIQTRFYRTPRNTIAGETLLTRKNGKSYEVTTMKRYSGLFSSTFMPVTITPIGTEFNSSTRIHHMPHDIKRGTLNAVKKAHNAALKTFLKEQLDIEV